MAKARTEPEFLDKEPKKEKQNTALAIPLKVLPKSQWTDKATNVINTLLISIDALSGYVIIRQYKEICDSALKLLEPKVVEKMNGKEVEVLGAKIALRQKAKKYEYNSSHLNQMESELELLSGKIKNYKDWMEHLKEPAPDPDTGEITHPAKLIEAGITPAVTFPK